MRILPLIILLWATGAHAENYESCLTHSSAAYLEAFKSELDKHDIPARQCRDRGENGCLCTAQ